jgi:hypothetical protein
MVGTSAIRSPAARQRLVARRMLGTARSTDKGWAMTMIF